MEKIKNYEDLTIRDPFMFGKICSKPENRKLILDSLLQIDLNEKDGGTEKHIQEYKNAKYARLDLLVEDENNTVYDAEMQNESTDKTRQEELPKRSRYYQALIDTAYFNTGGDYTKLPESYIIFICTFDPFGKNLPIYSFTNTCKEINIPWYDDGSHKVFFNTTADLSTLPLNMQNMLKYINNGETNDVATLTLDNEVKEAQFKEEWRAEYMLTLVHDIDVRREGFEDGYENGYDAATLACQKEIDNINHTLAARDAALAEKDTRIRQLEQQLAALQS